MRFRSRKKLHILLFLSFCTFTFLSYSDVAGAAASIRKTSIRKSMQERFSEKACQNYEKMVGELYKMEDRPNIYVAIRRGYVRCSYYDPFGSDTLYKLLKLVDEVNNDKDPQLSMQALRKYKELVKRHIGNLDVVLFAEDMSKTNFRFGRPDFFKKIKDGIVKDIYRKGVDGRSPEKAFRIVTYAEENYILAHEKGKLLHSKLYDVGGVYYNVHDFIDMKKKRRFSLYVDVSIPIRVVKAAQEDKGSDDLSIFGKK